MENKEFIDYGIVKSRPARWFLSVTWIAFLFVVIVGLKPFATRSGIDDLAENTGIYWARQLVEVGLALAVALTTFFRSGDELRKLPFPVPWPILLVITWCGLSLLGSPVPLIGFRRLALTALVIFTIFTVVEGLGHWYSLRLFGLCLALMVIVSVAAGPIVPNAVHLSAESDVKLVGAWRGIFYHKNHAGLVAALCIITSFFLWRMGQGRAWIVGVVFGIILLVMSRSKTSLILCIPALIAGLYLGKLKAARQKFRAILMLLTGVLLILILATILIAMGDKIMALLDDPTAFTGRMTIWRVLWEVISEHPFSGIGYASIYDTGIRPSTMSSSVAWLSTNAHGHNGYLDIMASTGIIGCIMAIFAFIISPFLQITRSEFSRPQVTAGLLYATLCFVTFHNLFETSLLERVRPAWVAQLMVCAIALAISRNSKRG
jgi:exopolysaccharide production protein ExoQ